MNEHRTPDLQLSHFAKEPLGEIRSTEQKWRSDYRSCYEKPKGLWVSVDGEDDWPSWCASADFEIGGTRHRVLISNWSRLLILKSSSDLRQFTKFYGRQDETRYHDNYIEWPAVAAAHGGVIIAPYCWDQRLNLDWYYGWDCASGCIWDASVIARVEEIREVQAA
jgi:hypothetical protein